MAGEGTSITSRVTSPDAQSAKAAISSRLSGKQDDDSQRRTQPPPKAWGSGYNPIVQRSNTPNGVSGKASPKPGASDASSSNTMEKSQDRYVQLLTHAMGFYCTITTKDGGAFVGIPTSTKGKAADTQFVFQNVRIASQSDLEKPQTNVAKPQHAGDGPLHAMTIPASQIAFILASDAAGSTRPIQGKGFMTDTEISGNAPMRERKLERWQAPSDSSTTFADSSRSGDFDQFKVNEQKFGVKSTYNEDDYTTRIDRTSASYAERSARAAKIAAEIEGDNRSNAWSEHRGVNDEGYDEEDLYSGVRRETPLQSGQPNRYVPPSRRSQQGASKEAVGEEALVDPAILSSQVAQTNSTNEPKATPTLPLAAQQPSASGEKSAPSSKAIPPTSAGPSISAAKGPAAAGTQTQQPSVASQAPANVAAAFKQFANLEKMKVQNHKHMKNQQDKAVKVNDLKKFALNFKLNTPVPKDLLPILAKDESKQNEIVKKAQQQAEQNKKQSSEHKQPSADNTASSSKRQPDSATSGTQAQKTATTIPSGPNVPQNTLSQRLQDNRRQHQQQQHKIGAPSVLPIHERQNRQTSFSGGAPLTSPTKVVNPRAPASGPAVRLNPQVGEFKPNPMAVQFKPASSMGGTTNVSSPSTRPATRTITPVSGPTVDFLREARGRDRKGVPRKPITWQIDNIKTIKPREEDTKGEASNDKEKESAAPTIQQPFKQKVDWIPANLDDAKVEALPKYKEMFARDRMSRQASFATASPNNTPRGPGPHPHQYPMQNGGPNMHPMSMPGQMHHMPGPGHHFPQGGHYDDHQMRPSPSVQSYAAPSPRMNHAYPSQMPPGAQMGYPPNQYMNPGHGMPPRQYSNGPAAGPGMHMQHQMMMHQGPNAYMPQPNMMPMPPQYPGPQPMYQGPPQANGYPSPGRGAPPMMHSGSHQGHHPQPYTPNSHYAQPYQPPPNQMMPRGSFNGQPNFPQSPYQQHAAYAARTPSHGYAQPHQPAMMTPQTSSAQPAATSNDESK